MNGNNAVLNLLSVLFAIMMSYFSQILELNNNTIRKLSLENDTLFTPSGFTFSIWGVIYIGLIVMAGHQLYKTFIGDDDDGLNFKTGPWFIIANVANALWVVVWLYEYAFLSVILMLIILFSLIKLILINNMERWDAPFKTIAYFWWPICLYSGWITVATIANISSVLVNYKWDGWGLNEVLWANIMIVVAVIINLLMIYTRNMREFALVGVWAFVGIYFKNIEAIPNVAYVAMAAAILLFLNIAYHGFLNRKTNPMYKLVNGKPL
ncbi:hypothetical protein [Gillisia marina]|uniref:hypothetical protein n=1 Tax=Gillisia marina TaxID=1167637 RepID=UPI00029A2076|nr:hypothetical protein [Gillisia marina]